MDKRINLKNEIKNIEYVIKYVIKKEDKLLEKIVACLLSYVSDRETMKIGNELFF